MYLSPNARSSAHARDSSMAPSDFSSISASSVWARAGYGRENLDHRLGVERDRNKFLKKDWTWDNRSSYGSPVSSSSSSYSCSFSLSGHVANKRRAAGFTERHEPVKSGRYEPPSESRRDGPSVLGSSSDTEKHIKDIDDVQFKDILLSPGNSISPPYDPSPQYGKNNNLVSIVMRDGERLKSYNSHYVRGTMDLFDTRERSCRRLDLYRKLCDFPKLDATSDWDVEVKGVLEGRIDRYGNAFNREGALLEVHKDQPLNECGSRGSSVASTGISTSTSQPYLRDVGSVFVRSGTLGSISPLHDDVCGPASMGEESNGDEIDGNFKKRPRLTWGQGLAKYEKEKTVEDPSSQKKSDECNHDVGGSAICATLGRCVQNADGYGQQNLWREEHAVYADAASTDVQCKKWHINSLELFSDAKSNEDVEEEACRAHFKESLTCSSMKESMEVSADILSHHTILGSDSKDSQQVSLFSASALIPNTRYVREFLQSIKGPSPTISKDVLTQYVEKVEFEIDSIEKEIMKLEKEQDFITEYVEKVDLEIDLVKKEIIKLENKEHIEHPCPHDSSMNSSMKLSEPALCSISSIRQPSPEKVAFAHGDPPTKGTANPIENTIGCSTDNQRTKNELIQESNKANELDVYSFTGNVVSNPCGLCLMLENTEAMASFNDGVIGGEINISTLLLSNKVTARETSDALSHLYPAYFNHRHTEGLVYASPQEAEVWKHNSENYEKKKKFLACKIKQEKKNSRFAERALIVNYIAKREAWKCQQLGSRKKNYSTDSCLSSPERRSSDATYFKKGSIVAGSAIVEGDSNEISMARQLFRLFPIKNRREFLRMPPMTMECDKMKPNSFKTKNGLVDDPISAEQERKTVNPWSSEEKGIFLEKYLLLGKNLRKIATFLEYKTVADCVQFYYLNQKSEEFEKLRHGHLLKNQRDSRSSALYLTTTVSSWQCDADAACLEGLSLVAAAAAAMSSSVLASEVQITYPRADKGKNSNKQTSSASALGDNASEGQKVSKKCAKWNGRPLRQLHELLESQWTNDERDLYLKALPMFGKDFHNISMYIGTKSQRQCKSFFSKACKRLGLDKLVDHYMSSIQDAHEGKANGKTKDTFKIEPTIKMEEHHKYHDRVEMFSAVVDEALHKQKKKLECEGNISVIDVLEPWQESSHTSVSEVIDKNCGSIVDNPINQYAFGESLVCEESLQLKTELHKLKKEPPKFSKFTNPPRTVLLSVSHDTSPAQMIAMNTNPVSPVVFSSQVKEKGSKGTETRTRREPTSWTQEEKDIFIHVLKTHGKNWERLRESLPAKSLTQIKTYFQNSKAKLSLGFEGIFSGNGKVSSLKRKADDSDSNARNAAGGRNVAQKSSVLSDGSLKGGPNSFQTKGHPQAFSTSSPPTMMSSSPLGPITTCNVQLSYAHSPCMIIQSQEPISSVVVVQPTSIGIHESCRAQSIVRPYTDILHAPEHHSGTQLISARPLSHNIQQLHDISDSEMESQSLPHLQPAVKEVAHNFPHIQNHQIVASQTMNPLLLTSSQGLPTEESGMCQLELYRVCSKPQALLEQSQQGLTQNLRHPEQTYPLMNEHHYYQHQLGGLKRCTQSSSVSETSMAYESQQSIMPETPLDVPGLHKTSNADIKLFGQSLVLQPAASSPEMTTQMHRDSLNLEHTPFQNTPLVNGDLEHQDQEILIDRTTRTSHADNQTDSISFPDIKLVQDNNVYAGICVEIEKGIHSDPINISCAQLIENSPYLSKTTANKNQVQECTTFSPIPNGQPIVAQGLPRVIDALVALAEWRLQNSGSGKLTDEFLKHSWEALQRDPSAFLDIGKVSGTLARLCPGGSEMLQYLKQRLIYSELQHSQQQSIRNIAYLNGNQDVSPLLVKSETLMPEDSGMIKIRHADRS